MKYVIILVSVLFLSACSEVQGLTMKQAEYVCSQHGGVFRLEDNLFFRNPSVKCVNGNWYWLNENNLKGIK